MKRKRQAERRKYHFIYKTTCNVNGKFYYGMHSTDDLNDGYLGSGTMLSHSIRKHGRENFSIEILEFLPDRESLKQREKELITEDILHDPMCMNLTLGGGEGWDTYNKTPQAINRRVMNGRMTGASNLRSANKRRWKEQEQRMKEISRLGGIAGGNVSKFIAAREAAKSKASIEKRKETFKNINHQQGETNSQYGKKWIHSLTEQRSLCVSPQELDLRLNSGWILGRKMKFCGMEQSGSSLGS